MIHIYSCHFKKDNKEMFVKINRDEIHQILQSVSAIASEDLDEMAAPSYLHSNPFIRWLMWKRLHFIYNLARLTKDISVLDFGCGLGLFLPTLCDSSSRVYAIDLFPQFAQYLSRKRGLQVQFVDDIHSMAPESLDIIISADVMEHLEDPSSFTRSFHGSLGSDSPF